MGSLTLRMICSPSTMTRSRSSFQKWPKFLKFLPQKNSSNHDIQTTKPAAETIAKDSKEPVKAVSEAITKVTSDRAAASPPCEVSSTTINNEEKEKEKLAGNGKEKSLGQEADNTGN